MNSEKYKKCLEDREIILRSGYKKYIDKMPTKAEVEKAFSSDDETLKDKIASKLENYRKKAVERLEYIEKITNISKEYRSYNYTDRAEKIEEKDLKDMSLTKLKNLAKRTEVSRNLYFNITGTTPEKRDIIRKKQELKNLKNPYKEAIKFEKKKTRKKKIGNFVAGFCGVALALNGGFLIGVGGIIVASAVIKNIADNYDLRKLRKQTRKHRKDNRERISTLEFEIEQGTKGLSKTKEKTKTEVAKTASPETKVEKATPKVENKEVKKEEPVAAAEVEELLEGLTEEKKVTVETPAEVLSEEEQIVDAKKEEVKPEVDELGVPTTTIKKETKEPVVEKKPETSFISSDNKKEEDVIAELVTAANNDVNAITNLRGVDLSTRFLKSERDLTEYYLYKKYGQEPTSVTVKALIDVEKSMDLLGDNTKSNSRSM